MFIKRQIFNDLIEHLSKKEITLIVGPRQVGKTTLMIKLQERLQAQRKNIMFLSLDFEEDKRFFETQKTLLDKINLEFGDDSGYVFIDEIQRKADAGLFLKGLYDRHLPYKFIVSGSGSLELKEKIHESLTGRKRMYEVNPVSFGEFVNYKTNYRYENKLEDFFTLEKAKTNSFFVEYLNFGGYPEVILAQTLKEKTRTINEIYSSYLEKDIAYLLKVEKLDEFSSLVRLLSSQIGNLINYSEIANTLNISLPTVKKYITYLEKTYVLRRLPPIARNTRKEISKSPVIYFNDLGLRNYSAGVFGQADKIAGGFAFENFIFSELQRKLSLTGAKLNYWRTKDKAEVDFVVSHGSKIIPLEVKYQTMKRPVLERSLRNFIERYLPAQAYVITKDLHDQLKINKTNVSFIPFWKVLVIGLLNK